jgi:Homeodomain-like domain
MPIMKRYLVTLTLKEQAKLREIIAKRSNKAEIVKRAYVLLSLDENRPGGRLSDDEIRQQYHVGQRLIERLRQRLVLASFDVALHGHKQTRFKEKTFDGRVEAQLIALRCSQAPDGYQKWSLRLLAETLAENGAVTAISHESVRQILKKTNASRGR